jgi:hypothetical protein
MNLEQALQIMLETQDKFATKRGVSDPDYISQQMQILANATAIVETHLAGFERDYEVTLGRKLGEYITTGSSASAAETRVRSELNHEKGQIKYLTRIVKSAWSQVGVAQSRHNHLTREFRMGGNIT